MMSKVAFMMQDQLRRNYVMITDIVNPTAFQVRGRLPFPQGMTAIAVLFKNKCPADVYAHPYFIEKQSDPSQASPQLHLTEESQAIMKIISGVRYMSDDNAKLDSTMMVVTDYAVEVDGRMPRVPEEEADSLAKSTPGLLDGVEPPGMSQKDEGKTLEERAMFRRSKHHLFQLPGSATAPSARSGTQGSSVYGSGKATDISAASKAAAAAAGADDGATLPGYSSFPTPEECAADPLTAYRYLKAALYGRAALREESEEAERQARRRKREQEDKEEEAAVDQERAVIAATDVRGGLKVDKLFEQRRGGYTVLYNPIEVNEKTFTELLTKLQDEERVVKAIVVPTRPAWRHIQIWADLFPDAEIISSGPIPLIGSAVGPLFSMNTSSSSLSPSPVADVSSSPPPPPARQAWRGGCQDLGNGLTGLSFPEVDLEAEAARETQRQHHATSKAAATAAAAAALSGGVRGIVQGQQQQQGKRQGTTAKEEEDDWADEEEEKYVIAESSDPVVAQKQRQEAKLRLRRAMARADERQRRTRAAAAGEKKNGAAAPTAVVHTGSLLAPTGDRQRRSQQQDVSVNGSGDADLVDVLWRDVSFFTERAVQPIGLRRSDAARVRVLNPGNVSPSSSTGTTGIGSSAPASRLQRTDAAHLTPALELRRIAGDAVTEEYVLYDHRSGLLACTDLFHGAYSDLDPANSWMARVWFKFMKRGSYKREDLVPRYKWLQVLQQDSLAELQSTVDALTRTWPIKHLLYAHGTPPVVDDPANALRRQWSLQPLHPVELPGLGPRRP